MKRLGNKKKILLLGFILSVISFLVIVIFGSTYKFKFDTHGEIANAEDISISFESVDEESDPYIIEVVGKKVSDGIAEITLKSLERGIVYINVEANEFALSKRFYVHNFGIITEGNFFGNASGDIVFPISSVVFLLYVFYISIKTYRQRFKRDPYQYKNITRLGLIVFLGFAIIVQAFTLFDYYGLWQTIADITTAFGFFSIVLFPLVFLLSIFMMMSSIVLAKKEGFSWRNFLGFLIGFSLCLASILPEALNIFLQQTTVVDVHDEQGIALYVQDFIESAIYMSLVYVECVLIGTIVVTVRSARRVPEFNKDYLSLLEESIKE